MPNNRFTFLLPLISSTFQALASLFPWQRKAHKELAGFVCRSKLISSIPPQTDISKLHIHQKGSNKFCHAVKNVDWAPSPHIMLGYSPMLQYRSQKTTAICHSYWFQILWKWLFPKNLVPVVMWCWFCERMGRASWIITGPVFEDLGQFVLP